MVDNAALVTVVALALLGLAFFTYGRFMARRIFKLDPQRITPAHELRDGIDYVPTQRPILFGHHFASIAGLGPILGPALAVIWGWVPAVLWVVFGCIFIGAVHDLGALVVSLRYQGRSVGDVCGHLMGQRARLLALVIIFFLMALAMGAFVNAISALFVLFRPDAVIPSLGLIVVAVCMGLAVYKLRVPLAVATVVALAVFAGLIASGVWQPVPTYQWFLSPETRATLHAAARQGNESTNQAKAGGQTSDEPADPEQPSTETAVAATTPAFLPPYGASDAQEVVKATGDIAAIKEVDASIDWAKYTWIGVLLAYAFVASVLPVWLLLQPRDYINSFQLYFALATLLIGLIVAVAIGAPEGHIDAARFRPDIPLKPVAEGVSATDSVSPAEVPKAPPWLPILFVTIACGAVSGFHALVSSGTTVKQLNRETDAWPIGYGGMLVEGVLAVLVIMACVAGLGAEAWGESGVYATWSGISGGLASKLSAVVHGGANFAKHLGIPVEYGRALLAVTIVSFALTTLDSATRLLRFNVEEICRSVRLKPLANRYFGSLVAVGGIAFFGLVPAGMALWTLFGTTNQLLAGLTLLTVSVFLYKLRRPVVYTLVPMVLMLVFSVWAMCVTLYGFWTRPDQDWRWVLTIVSLLVLGLSFWLIVEAILSFRGPRGEPPEEQPGQPAPAAEEALAPLH